MKSLITTVAIVLAGFAFAAQAAEEKSTSRLGQCSKEAAAKGLKGDARKQYLSECAKGAGVTAAAKKDGSRLGACSKEAAAKGLKGDERSKYLSECNKKA